MGIMRNLYGGNMETIWNIWGIKEVSICIYIDLYEFSVILQIHISL